ncbi:hypothetical protein Taro_007004 [Colocasia esculenta]|uniref:Uncharacterized protein n=1 Tax=Colocasia esculenta TaxID=4460 RepID=A0A843U2K2_COLES|nr:hypothetical protein [Colocasia esculenta]
MVAPESTPATKRQWRAPIDLGGESDDDEAKAARRASIYLGGEATVALICPFSSQTTTPIYSKLSTTAVRRALIYHGGGKNVVNAVNLKHGRIYLGGEEGSNLLRQRCSRSTPAVML